ncbi:MAG: metallopeptidase family protein [Dehalococcoidia bacterium]|nr:metallopeptidase family protein [Dehalococcoidia bacterium]
MDRERFLGLVEQALLALPEQFRDKLSNIDIQVEDYPSADDLRAARARGRTLLGLYRGVPLTRRGVSYNLVPPDRIVIFQRPIERVSGSDEEVVERVGRVVRHEIAHHFGIDDESLRRMGVY